MGLYFWCLDPSGFYQQFSCCCKNFFLITDLNFTRLLWEMSVCLRLQWTNFCDKVAPKQWTISNWPREHGDDLPGTQWPPQAQVSVKNGSFVISRNMMFTPQIYGYCMNIECRYGSTHGEDWFKATWWIHVIKLNQGNCGSNRKQHRTSKVSTDYKSPQLPWRLVKVKQ